MSVPIVIRKLARSMPECLRFSHALIPYSCRPGIGRTYAARRRELSEFDCLTVQHQQQLIAAHVREIVTFAASRIPFYKAFYARNDFHPQALRTFEDLSDIPIVRKADLQAAPLEERSAAVPSRYLVNTAGSTGQALEFYIEADSMGHELAHMHRGWERLGFGRSDVRLVFNGRSTVRNGIEYDGAGNQHNLDIYRPFSEVEPVLLQVLSRCNIAFLHGYPSAIYEFARNCCTNADLMNRLRKTLKGVLLGSEFPIPAYRRFIEQTFGVPTHSWYGHTERCVLAHERSEWGVYHPFQTYGYCEAVRDEQSGKFRLVGTSFHNHASPLIRYDTGDFVDDIDVDGGILRSFRLESGRGSDVVLDRNGARIPLTGLVFGRHHEMFGNVEFVQVFQSQPGSATILVVPRGKPRPGSADLRSGFDARNVAIDFEFRVVDAPVRTRSGKMPILVTPAMLADTSDPVLIALRSGEPHYAS